jgi:alpha-L-fucosidase 2
MAWKINWWARLQDGNHAYKILEDAFTYIDPTLTKAQMSGGGTYPNLFDAHPPFQIDGNFGATAGITEMLLQSQDGMISLLPALPEIWQQGRIQGIKARGNFVADISWKKGKLASARLKSEIGGNCRLRTLEPVKVLDVNGKVLAASGKDVEGGNSNPLTQKAYLPPYQNNSKVRLEKLDIGHGYLLDFKTEKGKTYQIIAL